MSMSWDRLAQASPLYLKPYSSKMLNTSEGASYLIHMVTLPSVSESRYLHPKPIAFAR